MSDEEKAVLRARLETADRVVERIMQHHSGGADGSEMTFEGGRRQQLAPPAGHGGGACPPAAVPWGRMCGCLRAVHAALACWPAVRACFNFYALGGHEAVRDSTL